MLKIIDWLQSKGSYTDSCTIDLGLLFMRLGVGLTMAFSHGYGKLMSYSDRADTFPDPLGISSPVSLALTVFAEFFCALALAAGFATRALVIPLIVTMFVAVFVMHWDDPFGKKEFGLLYLLPFITIFITGPGRLSLDYLVFGKKK